MSDNIIDLAASWEKARVEFEAEYAAASPQHRAIFAQLREMFKDWEGDQTWLIAKILADVAIGAGKAPQPSPSRKKQRAK